MNKEEVKKLVKKLKTQNEAPEWLSSMSYLKLLAYLRDENGNTVTPRQRYKTIAKYAAKYLPTQMQSEYEDKFFQLIWKGWLAPSTPIMSNLGIRSAQAVSCSASIINDSLWDIAYTDYEVAMLSKNGFGTAAFLNTRGSYEDISGGGKTNHTKDWVEKLYNTQKKVSQNGTRRGSCAIYLDFWHKDLLDVLAMLKTHDLLHLGIVCDDSVKEKLEQNDEEALQRYKTILTWRLKKGKPYIIFIDNARRQDPSCYKELGLSTKHSNLCVHGDTYILTDDGYKVISELENKKVNVWNGEEFSETVVYKTGEGQELLKLSFSNGSELMCTPYHKFYGIDGKELRASELKVDSPLLEFKLPNESDIQNLKVTGIETVEGLHNTYCFTEPKRNMGIFNGVLAGNCSEIFLHTDSEHTLSCVLSSMNGAKFDEWKDTDAVFTATIFLDCIAEDLIQRGSKVKGLERVVRSTKKGRALGLGLLGYHTYLQDRLIPFDSFEARMKNVEIFSHLQKESTRASEYLAELLGEPEWCKGTGKRNTHNIAIAPNTGSAFMVGGVSQGIEPFAANVFTQKLPHVGSVERINPSLLKLLKDKGIYDSDIISKIALDKGSVQNIDELSDHEKKVFKTAFEINQKVLIDYAEHRQQFIDQGQSLNLFFSATEDEDWIHSVHRHAFQQTRLKSLYYVRSQSGIDADKGDECEACSG